MIILNNSVHFEYKNIYSLTNQDICFPVFQRGYSWKKEQTQNMLDDILTLVDNSKIQRLEKQIYFLDFIWYQENDQIKIADGQQRLITLNILIKCIRDFLSSPTSSNSLKMFNIEYDDLEFNQKYKQFFVEDKKIAPFKTVYSYFNEFIKENESKLSDIVDVLENNIYICLKKAENVDDAFEIFKQINSGGKPLTKDDVIKTTLVQYSNKYDLPLTEDFDLKDIKNLIISYYKLLESHQGGNCNNLALMSFMNKNIVNNKESFKRFYDYLNVVKDINKHSIYFVIDYLNKSQLLNVLYVLGIKEIDFSSQRDYLEMVLLPLCLMSTIWKIKKINPGGITKSLFDEIIDAIKQDKTPTQLREIIINFVNSNSEICKISLECFAAGLGTNIDQKAKKALLIMDIIQHNTSGTLNIPAINLEHIFPQNPCHDWVLNGWSGNEEERFVFINSIGNYLLLSESVNKKIQNKYIVDKVEAYKEIIPKDTLLQTKINTVDFDKFESNKEKYIFARQNEIAQTIQQTFFFGKMLITE